MAIAELIKVDSREVDLVLRDQRVTSVRDLKVVCRKRLQRYIPVMSNMRREGQMLPMKFEARLYDRSITTHKTAPLGATKSMKVNDQQ